jgi:putative membrane protein
VLSHFRPSWVRFAPFTLSGALTALAVVGFLWRIESETHANIGQLTRDNGAFRTVREQSIGVEILIVVLVALLFVVLASTAGYVLAFWNFTLTRHRAGTLQVRRGLITSRTTSIEERRLAGAELSEPLLLRAVGGARLIAIATGLRVGRGAERGGTTLLPAAPRASVISVAGLVTPGRGLWATPLIRHGARATRRRFTKATVGSLVLVAVFGFIWWVSGGPGLGWLYALLLVPVMLLVALDRARSLGHLLIDGYLVSRLGSFIRRRCALQTDAVIGWNFRSSFFARRAGLTTLVATTAAGRQGYRVQDINAEQAIRLAEAAVPGLLLDFIER